MQILDEPLTGGCQCGAVRFRATQRHDNAHVCHCRMCQKAVGNAFAALVAVPKQALTWTRGRPAVWQSSARVSRGFCRQCGTPLTYDDAESDRINLTLGALDHPGRVPPVTQDGIEGRLSWFAGLNDLPEYGETEQAGQYEWAAAIRASNRQHPDHDTAHWPATDQGDGTR